jgi:hypothetical protein
MNHEPQYQRVSRREGAFAFAVIFAIVIGFWPSLGPWLHALVFGLTGAWL